MSRLQVGLAGLFLLLGCAAISMPLLVRGMEDAMSRTLRHELAWTVQNGRNELNEAYRRLAELDGAVTPDGIAGAMMAGDILFSRLTTWDRGQIGVFIRDDPERIEQLKTLNEKLTALDTAMSGLENPASRRQARVILAEMIPIVTSISADAYARYTKNLSEASDNLRFYQRSQITVVAALFLSSLVLLVVLSIQNRNLKISHRRERDIAEHNAYLAAHDPLTSLANRKTFLKALHSACASASGDRALAVIAIDLDGFKPINDVLGHKAGDQLLIAVGARLSALAKTAEGGLAARFGGDEFLMLMRGVSDPGAVEAFAEGVREELRMPVFIDRHRVSVDATVGIAIMTGRDAEPAELIHHADIALNLGKSAGKGSVRTFHPAMLEGATQRRQLEIDLTEADLEAQFEPHFQPVVDMTTRRIIGVEALARWFHPKRGLVSPGEFIPVAESSGRIVDIGAVILRKACVAAMSWPTPIAVAVNLSAVQLMRIDVPALVRDVLAQTGLPPARLKLEITESVLIHDARGTHRLMLELQEIGITVSLDDFGTGYSSLSYLRNFPFDELKIDQSFVADIGSDRHAAAIVQTILGLARNLDMSVVAEGIETEDQAKLLNAMGCAKGQGWHFGRPVPSAELMRLLENQCELPASRAA